MTLQNRIYNLASFQRQLKRILVVLSTSSLSNIELSDEQKEEEIDINNVLSCASILSQSSDFQHQEAALRVAHYCIESTIANNSQKAAAAIIFDNLTNQPAIALAKRKHLINEDFITGVPLPLLFDITKRKASHTIFTNGKEVYLNKFQKDAYDKFKTSDVVSVSAPTSAGKSFVLYRTLGEIISNSTVAVNIVYIVPTRALISQVENDFKAMLIDGSINDIHISSVPKLDSSDALKSKLFIFTQERLHWFNVENPLFTFDYLIVDEAQKIGEGSRGILLQQKLEELISNSPNIKIFFSSPLTSNPEILYENLSDRKIKAPVNTEFVAVNQNLIYVSPTRGNTKKWKLELCVPSEKIDLGFVNLENRPTSEFKKVAFIVHSLSMKDGGNIIYMNNAAYAEKLSNVLYDTINEEFETNFQIEELISYTKKHVHRSYLLNKVLSKRIAFHYGNMPLLVRQEIERLFSNGVIKYLICTSTLLEGVNLPAKSIFLRKPTKGTGKPLSNVDFWNLAGRAGRLGKEFHGNIICIDPYNWENEPQVNEKKQAIKKSIDKVADNPSELLTYIRSGLPRSLAKEKNELEYAFTYYFNNFKRNNLRSVLDKSPQLFQELTLEFNNISQIVTIPDAILFRNPGISPISQQNLYNNFSDNIGEIEKYIPEMPEADNAVQNSYITVIGIINRYLSGDSELLNYYYAVLVVNWMRGYPLSVLITNSINYYNRKEAGKSLNTIIRETMRDIEEFARFKFAKYSACYIDILRFFLIENDRLELAKQIPDLHIWLEFGVSQGTQISLIGLGLSRQSAITLSGFIANDNLSKEECRQWIMNNDLSSLQLTQIVLNEIVRCLEIKLI